MWPNFFIIGAPKAGTTSLWAMLQGHPQVFMCEPKEPAYFLYDERYRDGRMWYESLFEEAGDARAVGEATTEYSRTISRPEVLPRIARDVPNARLIYVVRHPQEVLVSRWRQEMHNGNEVSRDFSKALRESAFLLENVRYGHCLDTCLEYFPSDRILVLFFEDIKQRPGDLMRSVEAFLGLDAQRTDITNLPHMNVGDLKNMDSRFLSMLRKLPGADAVRSLVPPATRRALRHQLREPVPVRPVWSEADATWLEAQVGEELRDFLLRVGRGADFWLIGAGP